MKYTKKREIDFKTNMQQSIYLPLLFGSALMWLYVYVFIPSSLFSEKQSVFLTILCTGIVLFLIQCFVFTPLLLKKRITTICEDIVNINENPDAFMPIERTELVSSVVNLPIFSAWISFFVNVATNAIMFLCIMIFFRDDVKQVLFLIAPFIISAGCSGLLVFDSMTKICSKASMTITTGKLDEEKMMKEKHFGTTILKNLFFHLFFPFLGLISTVILLFFFKMTTQNLNLFNAGILIFALFMFMGFFVDNYKKMTIGEIYKVNKALDKFSSKEFNEEEPEENPLPFDLNMEISYTPFLINRLISSIEKDSRESNKTAKKIVSLTQDLDYDINQASESLSIEGETITSAITSMNIIEEYIAKIEKQVSEVSVTSNDTLTNINEGSAILGENMEKISQITQSNIETISGIKDLSEQIENVWSVIATIDSITEKTRTIAFNAEIETSSMGDTGENFHIVATEIRRLADSITDSTLSIRKKITSIQHASDNLVITSEGGTEKIREESELFTNLEGKFDEIRLSGQVTEESATLIKQFLQNQKDSFDELSRLIRELNSNFIYFKKNANEVLSTNSQIQNAITGALNGGEQNAN